MVKMNIVRHLKKSNKSRIFGDMCETFFIIEGIPKHSEPRVFIISLFIKLVYIYISKDCLYQTRNRLLQFHPHCRQYLQQNVIKSIHLLEKFSQG